jgi:hypothetical protein
MHAVEMAFALSGPTTPQRRHLVRWGLTECWLRALQPSIPVLYLHGGSAGSGFLNCFLLNVGGESEDCSRDMIDTEGRSMAPSSLPCAPAPDLGIGSWLWDLTARWSTVWYSQIKQAAVMMPYGGGFGSTPSSNSRVSMKGRISDTTRDKHGLCRFHLMVTLPRFVRLLILY